MPSRVADQVVAAAVVAQVVIAAEPADADPVAARRQAGGAVHPGDDDPRAEGAQHAAQARPGDEVERAAERELHRVEPGGGEPGGAGGIAANHRQHGFAGAVQGGGEALEEQLGPAGGGAGHDVGDFSQRREGESGMGGPFSTAVCAAESCRGVARAPRPRHELHCCIA